jgi:U3 small nucleolar RNA-associated protein 6
MAAASDKARFFLEQSVPELKEYEHKKVFSSDEISSIARKRSDFEHKINSRGPMAADFARYAEFEINVEALRKKRVQRLGIKSTNHTGQRRIFFVFDRGTKKHPGDVGLWLQSIEFARRQKAHKKLTQIFTNVLRLHPTRSELWIYAAQFAMEEHGDMTEARSYMQRGLRFCKNKKIMWIQYGRLEMSYIAKIHARRQILGIEEPDQTTIPETQTDGEGDDGVGKIAVEDIGALDENDPDNTALRKLESIPTQNGAIPIAIFDGAMSQFSNDPDVAYLFVTMLADYSDLPAVRNVLRHVLEVLRQRQCNHTVVHVCEVQLPVLGVPVSSTRFPGALRESLRRLKEAQTVVDPNDGLGVWARQWLQALLGNEDLDPALQTVTKSVLKSLQGR